MLIEKESSSYVNLAYTEVPIATTQKKAHLVFRGEECIDIVWATAGLTAAQVLDEVRYQMYQSVPYDEDLAIKALN